MNKAIDRTTVQVSDNKYRIYNKMGPINYKKPDGTFEEIDLTFKDSTSTIGNISLMNKGIFSVGKRKGNNPNKVVGIRPDINQHTGEQQLEFSLVDINIDGESQEFNVDTDLELSLGCSKVLQLVKIPKKFSNCSIEFLIHSKNLPIQNKKYEENTIISDYGFNLTNIGENNGSFTLNMYKNYNSKNKEIPYLDCYAGKIIDEYITTGEYSTKNEFGSSDLSEYTLEKMYENGSSIYFKNAIIFAVKYYNIENIENILVNQICDIYGLEVFDDGGNGKYFTKNSKKIGGYYTENGTFFSFFNTSNIPNKIKELFQNKSFEDTSFIDVDLNTFCNDIKSRLNKDLTVKVDSSYYKPINNRFKFLIKNESFYIKEPIVFDKEYKELNYFMYHTLKDNGNGTYTYKKRMKPDSALNINNAYYIDVNISTIQSDAILPLHRQTSNNTSIDIHNSTKLAAARNASSATGNTNDTGAIAYGALRSIGINIKQTTTTSQGSTTVEREYIHYQTFHAFNTSGISSTVTDAEYKFRCFCIDDKNNPDSVNIIALKSTYDGTDPGTDTAGILQERSYYNDFTGHTINWSASDVTEYSASTAVTQTSTPADFSFTLNADAKTDIENNSTFSVSPLEHDETYQNSNDASWGTIPATSGNFSYQRAVFVGQPDALNTAERPYLEVTTAPVSTPTENSTFFGANF